MPTRCKALGVVSLATLIACGSSADLQAAARRQVYRSNPVRRAARRGSSAPTTKSSAIQFNPAVMELGPGEEDIIEVRLSNPYRHPTIGSFRLIEKPDIVLSKTTWDGPLPAWGTKTYLRVRAEENADPSIHSLRATYFVDRAGDFKAVYPVRVMIPIVVTLVPDYEHSAVIVRVKNQLSTRTERGKVDLRSPDRFLQDQVSALLPPIPPGETREVSIPIVSGGIAGGERYRFDVGVTTWAGYKTTFSRSLVFYDAAQQ